MIWKQALALSLGLSAYSLAFAAEDACDGYGPLEGRSTQDLGDVTIVGLERNMNAGLSLVTADINGDGNSDLLVGAPGDSTNGRDAGGVYAFMGPLGDLGEISLADADLIIVGAGFEENAGWHLSNIGDIDGDNDDEVLIGTDPRSGNPDVGGVAYLLAGNPGYFQACAVGCYTSLDLDTIDPNTVRAKFRGMVAGDRFGSVVGPRIDFNGDGILDIVVGAPNQSSLGFAYGAVYVWYGSQNGDILASAADVVINGSRAGSLFGQSMAAVDVTGDGVRELVVGAPNDDQAEYRAGQAFIFEGDGVASGASLNLLDASYRIVGRRNNSLGASIQNAGDLDQDGLEDLWIGAPGYGSDIRGKAYGVLGAELRPGTFIAEFDATFSVEGSFNARLGQTIASAGVNLDPAAGDADVEGDVNNDGSPDVLFAGLTATPAGGSARSGVGWVFQGPVGLRSSYDDYDYEIFGEQASSFIGYAADLSSDLNGDGFDDVVISGLTTELGEIPTVGPAFLNGMGRVSVFFGGEDIQDEIAYYVDNDSDGYGAGAPVFGCSAPVGPYVPVAGDCNDSNPGINPGAAELPAGPDVNCDGFVGAVDNDGDGVDAQSDCNDSDGSVKPGAPEICGDYIDNNCNGLVDEGQLPVAPFTTSVGARGYFVDIDGDGYGSDLTGAVACSRPTGLLGPIVETGGDCDDANFLINPGQPEYCDGVDNDCSGTPDDNAVDAPRWYLDGDGDTFGDARLVNTVKACSQPVNYVANRDDCDDTLSIVKPGASENCDTLDNDCDGMDYLGGPIVAADRAHMVIWGASNVGQLGRGDIRSLGDINSDGFEEMVFSEPGNSEVYPSAGMVYVVEGRYDAASVRLADRLPNGQPFYRTRIFGTRTGTGLGSTIKSGDINGDGETDLVLAGPGARLPSTNQGGVFVFLGPLRQGDLLMDDADLIIRGDAANHRLGAALDVGDLDGDGFADIVMGAPDVTDTSDGSVDGRVYVFYGRPVLPADSTVSSVADATIVGESLERLGQSLAVGDYDGDDQMDIAIGVARMADLRASRVSFLFGTAARFSGPLVVDGTLRYDASAGYGSAMENTGDIDGDGHDDLVVGSGGAGALLVFGERVSGEVFGLSVDQLVFVKNVSLLQYEGIEVTAMGDVNGDSIPDFAVGSGDGGSGKAYTYLVYGSRGLRSRAQDSARRTVPFSAIESFGRFENGMDFPTYSYRDLRNADGSILGLEGARIQTVGSSGGVGSVDIDGDGFRDIVVGSEGEDFNLNEADIGALRVLLGGPYGLDAKTIAGSGLNPAGEILIREVYEGLSFRKYVSVYNAGPNPVDLTGWELQIFTNGSPTASGSYDFTGVTLAGGANFVLLNPNASALSWFTASFGRSPDDVAFFVNHNGDDAYALVDGSGTVVDTYGVPGVDGTGQPWEGTDRIWTRRTTVFQANATWTAAEWTSSTDLSSGKPYANEAVAGISYEVAGYDVGRWYLDLDVDTWADASGAFLQRCEMHLPMNLSNPSNPRLGVTTDNTRIGDCDDLNANINPDAQEVGGDLVDSNCDGLFDPAAPPVVDVEITPVSPLSSDTLTANVDVFDADTPIAGVVINYQWYVGTSPDPSTWTPISGETNSTLGTGAFTKGDYVAVEVTGFDGTVTSDPVSDVVLIRNTKPSLVSCDLQPASIAVTDAITAVPAGLSDPDSTDTSGVDYQWWVFVFGTLTEVRDPRGNENNFPNPGDVEWGANRPSCFDSSFPLGDPNEYLNCYRGSKLYARCIPFDAEGNGNYVSSAVVEVINAAPVIDQCDIAPLSPKTTNSLTVTASGYDPDPGDTIEITYTWLKNGAPIGGFTNTTQTVLPQAFIDFPGQYSVRCTPTDNFGKVGIAVTSAAALVANTPPTQPVGLSLQPGNDPRSNQAVSVVLGIPSYDPDVDEGTQTLSYEIQWFNVDTGTVYNNPNPWSASANLTGILATLPVAATARGEDWEVRIRAYDGFDTSAVSTLTFTVRNSVPSFTGASILPNNPIATDDLTLATTGWSDYDGDPEKYDVVWYVNGNPVVPGPSPSTTLPAANFTRGDTVYAVVTAVNNGYPLDDGNTITTATVTVENAAPTQPVLGVQVERDPGNNGGVGTPGEITIPPPDQYDDIVCVLATPAMDVDGDPITYNIEWFEETSGGVSGFPDYVSSGVPAPVNTADQNWHLPYTQTSYGDRWKCRVTPFDNFGGGTPGPSAETPYVEVQDQTAPPAPSIDNIDPYQNETTITLTGTCVSGTNDCANLVFTCSAPATADVVQNSTCSGNTFIENMLVSRGREWTCSGVCSDSSANPSPVSGAVSTEVCNPFDSYEINTAAGATYGDTPGQAISEWSSLPDDNSASINIVGNVLDPSDVDWYRIGTTDNVTNDLAAGRDAYNFKVVTQTGVDDYDITVYRGTSPTVPSAVPECNALGQYDDYSFFNYDNLRTPTGQAVTDRPLPADRQACGAVGNVLFNECEDYTSDYWIKVQRVDNDDCQHYSLRLTNGSPP